ncbi:ribonuclease E, partial [Sodalis-like symbiont of Bactericera trigonica]
RRGQRRQGGRRDWNGEPARAGQENRQRRDGRDDPRRKRAQTLNETDTASNIAEETPQEEQVQPRREPRQDRQRRRQQEPKAQTEEQEIKALPAAATESDGGNAADEDDKPIQDQPRRQRRALNHKISVGDRHTLPAAAPTAALESANA